MNPTTPPNGTRKVGSGEYRAAGPAEETIPSPADAENNVSFQLAELQIVAQRMGEAAAELRTMADRFGVQLRSLKVAVLTGEHRANVQRAKIIAGGRVLVAHEREIRELRSELEGLKLASAQALAALEPTTLDPRVDP